MWYISIVYYSGRVKVVAGGDAKLSHHVCEPSVLHSEFRGVTRKTSADDER